MQAIRLMPFPRVGHKFGSKLFSSQPKKESLVSSSIYNVHEIKQRQTAWGTTTIPGAKTRQKFLGIPLERRLWLTSLQLLYLFFF